MTASDFRKAKISEVIEERDGKPCRTLYSPLWQADPSKIKRMAPIEFMGRYMQGWFDYCICDEIHQLAADDTAQGNALGPLASCTDKIVGLTGTLLGGYADDLFATLYRLEPRKMKEQGYEWGTTGRTAFAQDYGFLRPQRRSSRPRTLVPRHEPRRQSAGSLEPHRFYLANS
jgi:hypothetical protein